MILTNDANIAKRARSLRHHGIDLDLHARNKTNSWEYDVVDLGFNYRLPDINCALGISQLAKSEHWLQRRREIVATYNQALYDMPMIQPPTERDDCHSAWHLYIVRLNLEMLTASRAEVFAALRAENIGVNVHYIPIPWMTHYTNLGYLHGQWPVAEGEYERMISLPIYPSMKDQDVTDVITALHKIMANYGR